MKRNIIIVLLLHISSLLVLAQKSYQEQFDNQVGIKKEQVKTGILYSRVIPFAGLQAFGQNGRKDTPHYEHSSLKVTSPLFIQKIFFHFLQAKF